MPPIDPQVPRHVQRLVALATLMPSGSNGWFPCGAEVEEHVCFVPPSRMPGGELLAREAVDGTFRLQLMPHAVPGPPLLTLVGSDGSPVAFERWTEAAWGEAGEILRRRTRRQPAHLDPVAASFPLIRQRRWHALSLEEECGLFPQSRDADVPRAIDPGLLEAMMVGRTPPDALALAAVASRLATDAAARWARSHPQEAAALQATLAIPWAQRDPRQALPSVHPFAVAGQTTAFVIKAACRALIAGSTPAGCARIIASRFPEDVGAHTSWTQFLVDLKPEKWLAGARTTPATGKEQHAFQEHLIDIRLDPYPAVRRALHRARRLFRSRGLHEAVDGFREAVERDVKTPAGVAPLQDVLDDWVEAVRFPTRLELRPLPRDDDA